MLIPYALRAVPVALGKNWIIGIGWVRRAPYRYSNAPQLLEDFWQEVYAVLDELGVER
jgi:hypothetical protein